MLSGFSSIFVLMKAGVYIFTNKTDGKVYIGSSVDVYGRLYDHYYQLINNIHSNSQLQRAWNKDGAGNFEEDILEFCDPDQILIREQYYFDTKLFAQEYINSNHQDKRFRKLSYNINPIAGNSRGKETSPETLVKMSLGLKAFWSANPDKVMRGENHPFFGKEPHNKGIVGKVVLEERRKRVIRINIDLSDCKVYDKLEDVHKDGFGRTYVRKCCNGDQPIYKDYFWMFYSDFLNDEFAVKFLDNARSNIEKFKLPARLKRIEVIKKDSEGNVLAVFDTAKLDPKTRRIYHLLCQRTYPNGGTNKYKGYFYDYGKEIVDQ